MPEDDGAVSAQVVIYGYRYGSDDALPKTLSLNGEPGTRAPHVWLSSEGRQVSTIHLFGAGFVLLAGDPESTSRRARPSRSARGFRSRPITSTNGRAPTASEPRAPR